MHGLWPETGSYGNSLFIAPSSCAATPDAVYPCYYYAGDDYGYGGGRVLAGSGRGVVWARARPCFDGHLTGFDGGAGSDPNLTEGPRGHLNLTDLTDLTAR